MNLSPGFVRALITLRSAVAAVLRWQVIEHPSGVALACDEGNPYQPDTHPGLAFFVLYYGSGVDTISISLAARIIDELTEILPLMDDADRVLPPDPVWTPLGGYRKSLNMLVDAMRKTEAEVEAEIEAERWDIRSIPLNTTLH